MAIKKIRKKTCIVCGHKFTPQFTSLQKACSQKCAIDYSKLKKAANESQLTKDNVKNWNRVLQVKINQIIRLIDKGLPCLAKGNYPKQYHAGHIFSRGSNQTIRFNLHNIHRQSAQSNHFQNDDGLLREGLQNEYGIDYYNFVSELRQTPALKYSNMDYMALTKKASKIALKLRKDNKTYSLKDRISLRNEINNELAIYNKEFCIYNGWQ